METDRKFYRDVVKIALQLMDALSLIVIFRSANSILTKGVLRGGGDVRAAPVIDLLPLWLVALPLAAIFGLGLKWGIFWVYVGIMMESTTKFFLGVPRFRSRAWINDVTQFSHVKERQASQ